MYWSRPAVFRAAVFAELTIGLEVAMLLWALEGEREREGGKRERRREGEKEDRNMCGNTHNGC